MANTYLTRTPSSAGNRRTWTISVWLKIAAPTGDLAIFNAWSADNYAGHFVLKRRSTNESIGWSQWASDNYSNASYRDTNGWYHLVLAVDTTQSTASDRQKLYINGEQVTSWATSYTLGLNEETVVNSATIHHIGIQKWSSLGSNPFNGVMSHFHLCDGTAYAPTAFGETDSTTGEWKIKTSPSVSYGTNGFFILKDGNSVTDQSGNGNNWTVASGTLTNTEDCPSNVFATMNPLSAGSDMTFGNGNTKIRNDVGTWNSGLGTIAPGTGKYYWEVYVHGGGDNNTGVTLSSVDGSTHSAVDAGRVVYSRNGYIYREGLSDQGNYDTGVTYGDSDIIGVAFDTENGTLSFYKNGSAVSNSTTTATQFLRSNNEYIVQCGLYNGGEFRFNFGNGYFGTTAVSSAGTNASGIGIFEYDVPTGYTALSTKGLNE